MMARKFTGILADPSILISPPDLPFALFVHIVNLLFERYDLTPPLERTKEEATTTWMELATKLMIDVVPCFQNAGRKKGRPRTALASDIDLIVTVTKVISKRHCKVSEAISILVTSPKYGKRWMGMKKRTIENRYHRALSTDPLRRGREQILEWQESYQAQKGP